MPTIKISKRKLESYKRAEKVARECRYQFASHSRHNASAIVDMVIYWMNSTGDIKYKRPRRAPKV
jgi:hypothetical protein